MNQSTLSINCGVSARSLLQHAALLMVLLWAGVSTVFAGAGNDVLRHRITTLQSPPSRADEPVIQVIDIAELETEFPGGLTAMEETMSLDHAVDDAGNKYSTIWLIQNGTISAADNFTGPLFRFSDCQVVLGETAAFVSRSASSQPMIKLRDASFDINGGRIEGFSEKGQYSKQTVIEANNRVNINSGEIDGFVDFERGKFTFKSNIVKQITPKYGNATVGGIWYSYLGSDEQEMIFDGILFQSLLPDITMPTNRLRYYSVRADIRNLSNVESRVPARPLPQAVAFMPLCMAPIEDEIMVCPNHFAPIDGMIIACGNVTDVASDGTVTCSKSLTQADVDKIHFVPGDGSDPDLWEVYLDGEFARIRPKTQADPYLITCSDDLQSWIGKIESGEVTANFSHPLELKVADGAVFDKPVNVTGYINLTGVNPSTNVVQTATITVSRSLSLSHLEVELADIEAYKVEYGYLKASDCVFRIPDNISAESVFSLDGGSFDWWRSKADIQSDVMPEGHWLVKVKGIDECMGFTANSGTIEGNIYASGWSNTRIGHPNQSLDFKGYVYIGEKSSLESYTTNYFGSEITLDNSRCAFFNNAQHPSVKALSTPVVTNGYTSFQSLTLDNSTLLMTGSLLPALNLDVNVDCSNWSSENQMVIRGYSKGNVSLCSNVGVNNYLSDYTMTADDFAKFRWNIIGDASSSVTVDWSESEKAGILNRNDQSDVITCSEDLQNWVDRVVEGQYTTTVKNPLQLRLGDNVYFDREVIIPENVAIVLDGYEAGRKNSSIYQVAPIKLNGGYLQFRGARFDITDSQAFSIMSTASSKGSLILTYCDINVPSITKDCLIAVDNGDLRFIETKVSDGNQGMIDNWVIYADLSSKVVLQGGCIYGNVSVNHSCIELTVGLVASRMIPAVIAGMLKVDNGSSLYCVLGEINTLEVYDDCDTYLNSLRGTDAAFHDVSMAFIGSNVRLENPIKMLDASTSRLMAAMKLGWPIPQFEVDVKRLKDSSSAVVMQGITDSVKTCMKYAPYEMTESDFDNITFTIIDPSKTGFKPSIKWDEQLKAAVMKASLVDRIKRLQDGDDRGTEDDPIPIPVDDDMELDDDLDNEGDNLYIKIIHYDPDKDPSKNPTVSILKDIIHVRGYDITFENVNLDVKDNLSACNGFTVDGGLTITNADVSNKFDSFVNVTSTGRATFNNVRFKGLKRPSACMYSIDSGGTLRFNNGTYYGVMANHGHVHLTGTTQRYGNSIVRHLTWQEAILYNYARGRVVASNLMVHRHIGGRFMLSRGGRTSFRNSRFSRIRGRADELINPDTTMIFSDNIVELDGDVEEMPSVALEGPDAAVELASQLKSEMVIVFDAKNTETGEVAEKVDLIRGVEGEYELQPDDLKYIRLFGPTDYVAGYDEERHVIYVATKSGINDVKSDDLNLNNSFKPVCDDDALYDLKGRRVGCVAEMTSLAPGVYVTSSGHKFLVR